MGHNKPAGMLAGVYWLVSVVIVISVVGGSFAAQVVATEIINGEVTGKQVKTGSYIRSYSCNCKQRCSGTGNNRSCSTTCDTCYEDRYTKKWTCDTTVGSHTIESLDSTSRSVWKTPDPARYTAIKIGEPASAGKFYTNYVQAVPGSLFAKNLKGNTFTGLLPSYPQVYDLYRVNRFLTPGLGIANAAEWNEKLSLSMNKLGYQKEVNLIVVAAKTNDRSYAEALNHHWKGANKNDVIVVFGSTQWPKLDFVEVLSWSKSELFKVKLRDELFALGEVTPDAVVAITSKHIREGFVRRQMSEFEYLKDEIHSPTWVLVTTVVLQFLSTLILIFWFKHEQNSNRRSSSFVRTGSSRYWTGR
jgi:hypothetical protein